MSPAALALTLVRALPASPAILLARLAVVAYLAANPVFRTEIRRNCRLVLGRVPRGFWLRNGWRIGFNLALMARADSCPVRSLVDKADVGGENTSLSQRERRLYVVMVSFHFGIWESLPLVFHRRGHRVALALGAQRDRVLERMLGRLRIQGRTLGFRQSKLLLSAGPGLPEPRSTGPTLVGYMLDNTSRGQTVRAQSSGVRMRLPGAAFRVARRRRGLVAPVFGTLERGRLRIRVYPPGDEDHALGCLLSEVRRRPADWVFWGKAGALEAA